MTSTSSARLDSACASVSAEIARTDSKASLLIAFDGAALAGVVSLASRDLPLPAQIVGGAAVLALVAAAVLLLLVVRPALSVRGTPARGTFPAWARMDETAISASMDTDTRAARVQALSVLAVAKFARLSRAVDTLLASLALLTIAAVLAVIG
ncbi:Pycsar system effector family protein [Streptomyces albidoflavus]|uniref:Pycsar system effector family protein n=1 Tax=Streptomyces albidoflavus TaxID=1886 RepID=UPI001F5C8281|nr:Pycsar system effector family protein [Streptomyces albidoflavus]